MPKPEKRAGKSRPAPRTRAPDMRARRKDAAEQADKVAPETAHMGAVESQVVPTRSPGTSQTDSSRPGGDVNDEIDPRDELTPG